MATATVDTSNKEELNDMIKKYKVVKKQLSNIDAKLNSQVLSNQKRQNLIKHRSTMIKGQLKRINTIKVLKNQISNNLGKDNKLGSLQVISNINGSNDESDKKSTIPSDTEQNGNQQLDILDTGLPPDAKRRKISKEDDRSETPILSDSTEDLKSSIVAFMDILKNVVKKSEGNKMEDMMDEFLDENENIKITNAMKTKILTMNKIEELKAAQTYKGTKFSGDGEDKLIKAAEFINDIKNFEYQGKQIYGFSEEQAIRCIKTTAFTGTAAKLMSHSIPQAITKFNELYDWFGKTWNMTEARIELYEKFIKFVIPNDITPTELCHHITHYRCIFESITENCSPAVLAKTELRDIDAINSIYNAMCTKWQTMYDDIGKRKGNYPLTFKELMENLRELADEITKYNATHINQQVPLKHPNKLPNIVNRVQQNNNNINNTFRQFPYRPDYRRPGRGRFRRPYKYNTYYPNNNPRQNTIGPKRIQKKFAEPRYVNAWCSICNMGGHTRWFHYVITRNYNNKRLEFANRYEKEKNKTNMIQSQDKLDSNNINIVQQTTQPTQTSNKSEYLTSNMVSLQTTDSNTE